MQLIKSVGLSLIAFSCAASEADLNLTRYRVDLQLAGNRILTIEELAFDPSTRNSYPFLGIGQTIQVRVFVTDSKTGTTSEVSGADPRVSYHVIGKCMEASSTGVLVGLTCNADEKLAQLWIAFRLDANAKPITFSAYCSKRTVLAQVLPEGISLLRCLL